MKRSGELHAKLTSQYNEEPLCKLMVDSTLYEIKLRQMMSAHPQEFELLMAKAHNQWPVPLALNNEELIKQHTTAVIVASINQLITKMHRDSKAMTDAYVLQHGARAFAKLAKVIGLWTEAVPHAAAAFCGDPELTLAHVAAAAVTVEIDRKRRVNPL